MKKQVQISPSIAAGNLMQLGTEVQKLEQAGADSIHFDVMDGHFVPLLTIGVPFLEQMRKITKLHLDVHIMVTNPDSVFEDYLNAGADTLTFHSEMALQAFRICTKIREKGKRAGVALNPGTHWQSIEFLLPTLDQVTVMTVNPGFSRQPHIPEMHAKIRDLSEFCRQKNYKIDIQVDGGVNPDNAGHLVNLGATVLVAGGAVFNNSDYGAAIAALRNSKA